MLKKIKDIMLQIELIGLMVALSVLLILVDNMPVVIIGSLAILTRFNFIMKKTRDEVLNSLKGDTE